MATIPPPPPIYLWTPRARPATSGNHHLQPKIPTAEVMSSEGSIVRLMWGKGFVVGTNDLPNLKRTIDAPCRDRESLNNYVQKLERRKSANGLGGPWADA